MDKYEYLTDEDLGHYSPMGRVFTKWLDKDDQKEELFKRLKNIEDKNKQLLKAKSKTENIKEVTEANELIAEIRVIKKDVNYRKLKRR